MEFADLVKKVKEEKELANVSVGPIIGRELRPNGPSVSHSFSSREWKRRKARMKQARKSRSYNRRRP